MLVVVFAYARDRHDDFGSGSKQPVQSTFQGCIFSLATVALTRI